MGTEKFTSNKQSPYSVKLLTNHGSATSGAVCCCLPAGERERDRAGEERERSGEEG